MAKLHQLLNAFALLFSLLASTAVAERGTATFYKDHSHVACEGLGNKGDLIAAASSRQWKGGHVCGHKLRVRCIGAFEKGVRNPCKGGKQITVLLTDFCDNCQGDFDLSVESFEAIADKNAGKILIDYQHL